MAADPGASHARKGSPSPATRDLLTAAHDALRAELRDAIADLRPVAPPGTNVLGEPMTVPRPPLAERVRIVDLMGKIMGLLGQEVVTVEDATPPPPRRRTRRPEL